MSLIEVIVAGSIGLVGTLLGTIVSNWLTVRRDRRLQEEEKRSQLRRSIVEGAADLAASQARVKIPFSGSGFYYPKSEQIDQEALVRKLHDLLNEAYDTSKEKIAFESTQLFIQRLGDYVLEGGDTHDN